MSISIHRHCTKHGVVYGFFSGLNYSLKQRRHGIIGQQFHMPRQRLFRSVNTQLGCGRERNCVISAAIGARTASASHAQPCPACEALQIPRIDGGVGCNDHHARPVCLVLPRVLLQFLLQVVLAEFLPYGSTINGEYASKVGLYQNTDRVPAKILRYLSR